MVQRMECMLRHCLEHKWGTPVLGFLCVGILFPPWGYYFFQHSYDLQFNAWIVKYFTLFAKGLSIPEVLNVKEFTDLNVYPIYYARPLHWFVTLVAYFVPVRMAFWLVLGFISWIQYIVCAYAFTLGTQSRAKGNLIAAIVLLSNYGLTNAYGRGAVAEYAATSLLASFVCVLLALVINPARKKELLVLAAIFAALVGNIHAITTLSAAICFSFLGVYALIVYFSQHRGRWDIPVFVLAGSIVLGAMAHYLYLIWKTGSLVFISEYSEIASLTGLDNLFLRFMPVPVCFLLYAPHPVNDVPYPVSQVHFPFLFLQINIGLLIILMGSLYFAARGMLLHRNWNKGVLGAFVLSAVLLGMGLFLTWISVKPTDSALINAWLTRMQFPYRLITYINLLLMAGIFFLCPVLARLRLHLSYLRPMFLLLALGPVVYMLQLVPLMPIIKNLSNIEAVDKSVPAWDSHFYGFLDYATVRAFPVEENPSAARSIPVVAQDHGVGAVATAPVRVAEGEVLHLKVLPFVWNHVFATEQSTGKRVRLTGLQLRASLDPPGYYVNNLPAGDYVLEAVFSPPRIWRFLRYVYLLSMLLAAGALGYMGWRRLREQNPQDGQR